MTQSPDFSPVERVPLLDIPRAHQPYEEEMIAAVTDVLRSGRFLFGPDVKAFEQEMAELSGTEFGISCASGSDALLLSLMAKGIGPGDEVIVPSFTFFSTASAVTRLGGTPVFVDIDPATFNIDTNAVARAVTPATKAIIPVHLFGQFAEMHDIMAIAQHYGLYVVEDAAQAIDAAYHGHGVGTLGHVGCFSYYPTKNLGGWGDAGMLVTNDAELADKLQLIAGHGMRPRYHHSVIGINSRMDSAQAAMLRVKFKHVKACTAARQENAARYDQMFADAGLTETISLPVTAPHQRHVWNQYTIRVHGGHRNSLREYLNSKGVGSEIYYPIPLHMQECYQDLGYPKGCLPHTEKAAEEVLALPIFPELTVDEQQTLVYHCENYFAAQTQRRAA
jgi:dTDP-4-amino-4,6-dideoxygalactose transaminase